MRVLKKVRYDDIGRIYTFEDGTEYYSVTTMLGTGDSKSLEDWKKRVGKTEAKRIAAEAAVFGESFHALGEAHLLGNELPKTDKFVRRIFASTKRILDENVTKVHQVEATLVSEKYKLAGRVDAVVDWNDKLSILDFKLIGHHVRRWLDDYWIQTHIYAKAWQEMHGVLPEKLVLVVGDKKTNKSKDFTAVTKMWQGKAVRRVNEFHKTLEEYK